MIVPSVHLNGTSGDELLEQATGAVQALSAALEAAATAAPNGRDYYPQGDAAFTEAKREHGDRICRLTELRDEYQALAEAIADAIDARTR